MTTIKNIIKKIVMSGRDSHSLALSCSIGLYAAFSPFPGFHMLFIVAASYLLGLHFPTVFLVCSLNNPWTMIPFYSLDYAFGYWLVHSLLHWNPPYVLPLTFLFGSGSICLTSFIIGGNILGITSALMCYPIIKRLITKTLKTHQRC